MDLLSTNGAETIQKTVNLVGNNSNSDYINKNFNLYFEIDKSVIWIIKNQFKKVKK
jgi:hypothetical protein